MENKEAIEIFNRQINCYKTDREECVLLTSCSLCKHNVTPEELTEAMQMAISALEKQEAIKSCTPPSDDWEHYADRLHDIAYKCGYEEGKQDAGKWISCSERLPEDEYVLISKKPTKLSGSKWSVAIAIRTEDPRSRKIQWRDIGFGVIQDDKVLAWMPLPEVFKGE